MSKNHIQSISRTPVMACVGAPSTTAFLPCLLTIIADGFATLISGVGSLTPLIGVISSFAFDTIQVVPLAIRNLPWKITGPVL